MTGWDRASARIAALGLALAVPSITSGCGFLFDTENLAPRESDGSVADGGGGEAVRDGALDGNDSVPYPSVVASDAPLAYFRLGDVPGTATLTNEIAASSLSMQADGDVVLGEPGLVAGANATAARFGAGGGRLVVTSTDAALVDFPGRAPFSIEIWLRPTLVDDSYRRIFSNEIDGNPQSGKWQGYYLDLEAATSAFVRTTDGVHCSAGIDDGAALANAVHHLVATYDGDRSRLWIDGVEHATPCTNDIRGTGQLVIGQSTLAGGAFVGAMQEVAIYGRALPAERVRAHYRAGTGS